jgi:CBS domain-containing protein
MNNPIVAKEIMATKLVTLSPEMDVFDAIGLLLKHSISGDRFRLEPAGDLL